VSLILNQLGMGRRFTETELIVIRESGDRPAADERTAEGGDVGWHCHFPNFHSLQLFFYLTLGCECLGD